MTIPNDAHAVSLREFGPSYTTAKASVCTLTNVLLARSHDAAQVFRGDCFHNFFNFRWAY